MKTASRNASLKKAALICLVAIAAMLAVAQQDDLVYKVRVDLVLLSVAVTDHAGHYIKGLKPADFRIYEDGVPQKLALFSEGGGDWQNLLAAGEVPAGAEVPAESASMGAPGAGSNVFILMDTSNYMYKNFALAQDSIADF